MKQVLYFISWLFKFVLSLPVLLIHALGGVVYILGFIISEIIRFTIWFLEGPHTKNTKGVYGRR